jgi:hypothetical protein
MAVAQVFSEPPGRKYLLRQNLIAVTQARFLLAYSCAYGVLVRSMCVQASEIGVFTQSDHIAVMELSPEDRQM